MTLSTSYPYSGVYEFLPVAIRYLSIPWFVRRLLWVGCSHLGPPRSTVRGVVSWITEDPQIVPQRLLQDFFVSPGCIFVHIAVV